MKFYLCEKALLIEKPKGTWEHERITFIHYLKFKLMGIDVYWRLK